MRKFPLGLLPCLLALTVWDSEAKDSSVFLPYGPPQEITLDNPAGALDLVIFPWQEAEDRELDEFLSTQAKNVPAPEAVLHVSPFRKVGDGLVLGVRSLKSMQDGVPRTSMFLGCSYKRNRTHYRTVELFGPTDVVLGKDKDSTIGPLLEAAQTVCKQSPYAARSAALRSAVSAEPGKGDAVEQLVELLYTSSRSGDRKDEDTYALMKDGWAYKNPTVSLDDLSVERSRNVEPKKWVEWRANGEKWELLDTRREPQRWRELRGVRKLKPLSKGTRYDGSFKFVSMSGDYTSGITISSQTYTFGKDGMWSSGSDYLSGSGTLALAHPSLGFFTDEISCDEDGRSETHTATVGQPDPPPNKRNEKTAGCGAANAGTYAIESFTLEMTAENGIVTRVPFYELSERNLFIGSKGFWNHAKE